MSTENELEKLAEALAGSPELKAAVEKDFGNLPEAVVELKAAIDTFGNQRESDAIVAVAYVGYRSRDAEVERLNIRTGDLEALLCIGATSDTVIAALHAELAEKDAEIARLTVERDDLAQWKESALAVERSWDCQAVADALGMRLGSAIQPQILPGILALKQDKSDLVEGLEDAVSELAATTTLLERAEGGKWLETLAGADATITACNQLLAKHGKGEG